MTRPVDDAEVRRLIALRTGTAEEIWDEALATRPEYVRAALSLAEVPLRMGELDPKTRAFVKLSLEGALTHLRERGMRQAIAEALEAGATRDELIEVLVVASTLAVHGMNPEALEEVLAERGTPVSEELSERQEAIRTEYTAVRGYWRDFLDPTLRQAPEFLETYLEFSGAPWRVGVLEPKVREFIYLAFDTSATHLHMAGLRVHIHNALGHGATPGEIVEVMALAAAMGLQTLALGLEILDDSVS